MSIRGASGVATAAVIISVLVVLGAAGVTTAVYRSSQTSSTGAVPRIVVRGRYVGVTTDNLSAFDRDSGVRDNLTLRYLAWGTPLPTRALAQSAAQGAQTLIELQPDDISLKAIVAGRGDRYLESFGRAITGVHDEVWISFAAEMNARNTAWGYKKVTPTLYKEAFRHVHRVITGAGARNVDWVWQVAHRYASTENPVTLLWPGARYVNTVGIDGYYYFRGYTFTSIFAGTLAQIRSVTNKPVLLTETAIGPLDPKWGAGQARKMGDLFAGLRRYHLIGVVYFDHSQHAPPIHQAWALVPGSTGMAAYRRDAIAFASGH